jgi:hypothetical protein
MVFWEFQFDSGVAGVLYVCALLASHALSGFCEREKREMRFQERWKLLSRETTSSPAGFPAQ